MGEIKTTWLAFTCVKNSQVANEMNVFLCDTLKDIKGTLGYFTFYFSGHAAAYYAPVTVWCVVKMVIHWIQSGIETKKVNNIK